MELLLHLGLLLLTCSLTVGGTPTPFPEYADDAQFDYSCDGPLGPAHWGELHPDWIMCSTGLAQSPVNVTIRDFLFDIIPAPVFSYTSGDTVLTVKDHALTVRFTDDVGGLSFAGVEYKLDNFHVHSPSEHTFDGLRFLLEMHWVHISLDGKLAVVAVLYKEGEEDDFLAHAMEKLPQLIESGKPEYDIGYMDINRMDLGRRYLRYAGSLTTPPCSEGVSWIIMDKTRTVAAKQIQTLKEAGLDGNARPTQSLNGRQVYVSNPRPMEYA